MNRKRLLHRISSVALHNVHFNDFVDIVEGFGYVMVSIEGSHRIYRHREVGAKLNLQPQKSGNAKPYQIHEFLRQIKAYKLTLEE